jgi:hypothetical protein
MVEMRNACKILVRKLEGRHLLRDVGIDGRIILKWARIWTRFFCSRIGSDGSYL